MQQLRLKRPRLSRAEFARRADEYLHRIQAELLPEHAQEIVAINMDTGEYVLGRTAHESFMAFLDRWPNILMYQCRVDGGPANRFYGK